MFKHLKYFVYILLLFSVGISAKRKGDTCTIQNSRTEYPKYPNVAGKCKLLDECKNNKFLLQRKRWEISTICNWKEKLMCCPLKELPLTETIADKKCVEYHDISRHIDINIIPRRLLEGGRLALPREFPHMVAIGYKENIEPQWFCGGTLISKHFVLTAAHCTSYHSYSNYTYVNKAPNLVRLGDLDLKNSTEAIPLDIGIREIYRHPKYKFSSHYHDIALLELLESSFELDLTTFAPACLHTKEEIPPTVEAIGWGKSQNGLRNSHLQKVSLEVVDHNSCSDLFSKAHHRRLKSGIDKKTQFCAGNTGRDTCEGDSGGPVHYRVPGDLFTGREHFVVAGVTSFGKACGLQSSVYIRVSTYVSWIESIVWPSEVHEDRDKDLLMLDRIVFPKDNLDREVGFSPRL